MMNEEQKEEKDKEKITIPILDLTDNELDEAVSKVSINPSNEVKEDECSRCHKLKSQLPAGEKLQTDQEGKLYCQSCLATAKKQLLQGSIKRPRKKDQAKSGKNEKKLDKQLDKKQSQQRYVDAAQVTTLAHPVQMDKSLEADIADVIIEHGSDLIKSISSAENDLRQFFNKKDMDALKRAVDFPPLCNFMYVVYRLLKKLIHIDHPLANEFNLDLDNDKEATHGSFLRPFMPLFKYSFFVKHSETLEYYLNLAMVVAIDLEYMIKDAHMWDRRTERWCATVQAFIGEFQTRNNTFFARFEMISNSPIEIQKLFAGYSINLSKLASIERKINKDAKSTFLKAYQQLDDKDKVEQISSLFDSSYAQYLAENDKREVFKKLTEDKEVKLKPEELVVFFNRMDEDSKNRFMKDLRPNLYPDQIEALVPELAKYRGRTFADNPT